LLTNRRAGGTGIVVTRDRYRALWSATEAQRPRDVAATAAEEADAAGDAEEESPSRDALAGIVVRGGVR